MTLKTGEIEFTLHFENGETSTFSFNPNDKGIQERIDKFSKNLDKYVNTFDFEKYRANFNKGLSNMSGYTFDDIMSLPSADLDIMLESVNALNEIETQYNNKIKEELNKVFEKDISSTVFKYCEPMTVVEYVDKNGNTKTEMYILQFFYWIAEELTARGIKYNEAMQKHLQKYSKK